MQCFSELELDEFSASHQGIGGYLLSIWGLPTDVIEAVASHHSFEACAHAETQSRKYVFAANWIAKGGDETTLQQFAESMEDQQKAVLRELFQPLQDNLDLR